ncbi:MAG: acyltransferase family protein [Lachnospiraceae bacterium]
MLKGISCLTVILFHCPIQNLVGDAIIYALRFPIPIFLMISGYYSYGKETYLRSAGKTMRLLLFAEFVSASVMEVCFLTGISHTNPIDILLSTNWVKTIMFGSIFNGTLWYLYAMFWGWLLFYMASKIPHGFSILKCSIIPLLVVHIFGRMLVTKYSDINETVYLFRSTVLFVIPFFMIGRLIAEHQELILEKLKGFRVLLLMAAGAFLIIIEYVLWHQFMDLQVSTIFVSVGMFLFALQYPDFAPSKLLTGIGHISQYVYIFHIPVIILLNAILVRVVPDTVAAKVLPFLVIPCTVLVSYGYGRMRKDAIRCKSLFLEKKK